MREPRKWIPSRERVASVRKRLGELYGDLEWLRGELASCRAEDVDLYTELFRRLNPTAEAP